MKINLNGQWRSVIGAGELGTLSPERFGWISYDDIVEWSGKDSRRDVERVFTVTYAMPHGSDKRDGSLTKGQSIEIVDGMMFNVADTSNA